MTVNWFAQVQFESAANGQPKLFSCAYIVSSRELLQNKRFLWIFPPLPKTLFQDYDPDMPPELVAAAGIHDTPADNMNLEKSEVGHSDVSLASLRARPQFVCTYNLLRFFCHD